MIEALLVERFPVVRSKEEYPCLSVPYCTSREHFAFVNSGTVFLQRGLPGQGEEGPAEGDAGGDAHLQRPDAIRRVHPLAHGGLRPRVAARLGLRASARPSRGSASRDRICPPSVQPSPPFKSRTAYLRPAAGRSNGREVSSVRERAAFSSRRETSAWHLVITNCAVYADTNSGSAESARSIH